MSSFFNIARAKIRQSINTIISISTILIFVLSNQPAYTQTSVIDLQGKVCSNNDYALCSHAKCGCYDNDGNPIQCTAYPDNEEQVTNSSWSQCECPIVKTHQADNTAYDFNYAANNLSCDQRADPVKYPSKDYQLPKFVNQQTDLYSAYSYGDSLDDRSFGTKKSAYTLICQQQDLFTDCLSMACYQPEGKDHAVCYCKNRSAEQSCQDQPAGWNTLGAGCNDEGCLTKNSKVWSAACIQDTKTAMVQIAVAMKESSEETVQLPTYCTTD